MGKGAGVNKHEEGPYLDYSHEGHWRLRYARKERQTDVAYIQYAVCMWWAPCAPYI